MDSSLYIHIPFCERKCIYCDFYSIEGVSAFDGFLKALHREIEMYDRYAEGVDFRTIFFGGGTPSLLSPEEVAAILSRVRSTFSVSADAEITLETNPGTVDRDKLRGFRNAGVNRLSIGIQSFHEDELAFLGRIHDASQAEQCVHMARAAGFENVSLDLIYSLPGQSLDRWASTLKRAIALNPDHLSAYGLIVEDNTPLARMVRTKQVSPNPLDAEADLFEFTMATMQEHRYEHYEVSNYARDGRRSRHNLNYWHHGNYLGFGPSAHSFWMSHGLSEGKRWWNAASVSTYIGKLDRGEMPVASQEHLSSETMQTERLFLGLRSDGLDLRKFRDEFGGMLDRHRPLIDELVKAEIATILGDSLHLTAKGYLVCDEVCARLML